MNNKSNSISFRSKYFWAFSLIAFLLVSIFVAAYMVQRSRETRKSAAAGTASITISPQSSDLGYDQNNTYTVKVNSSNTSEKILFIRLDLAFDKNLVNLVSLEPLGSFIIPERSNGDKLVSSVEEANTSGAFYIVLTMPQDKLSQAPSGAFDAASFKLTSVKNESGSTKVDFNTNNMQVVSNNQNENDRELNLQVQSADITLFSTGSTASPSGSASSTASPSASPTASPTASSTASPTATPLPSVDPRADIDQNGVINLLDYIILLENFGRKVQ